MLIMKSEKRKLAKGIELPKWKRIRTLGEKENYKYLIILKANRYKGKNNKRVFQKNEKVS